MCQFPWRHLFVCIELEDGIERQKLNTCTCIEDVAWNMGEDLLHHAVCTVITILEGLTEQGSIIRVSMLRTGVLNHALILNARLLYQAIIDAPGIDPNAVERPSDLPGFAQSGQHLIPQVQHIPEAMPT